MIDFNLQDVSLDKIRIDSKLFNLITKRSYRVYGLREAKDNHLIELSFNKSLHNGLDCKKLIDLFAKNNIKISIYDLDTDAKDKIYIGLRRDLRINVILASTILQIVVYFLEGKLNIDENFIFPSIPSFYNPPDEKEEEEVKVAA